VEFVRQVKAVRNGPENYARWSIFAARALACALLFLGATVTGRTSASEADSRVVFGSESPQWLRAVGRLQVPSSRHKNGRTVHHLEDCSATLVAPAGRDIADTVVTAWHCLEYYRDLSRPISFTARDNAGNSLSREAYRLADGGGMHGDWAILRLYRPIAQEDVAALPVHPQQADPTRPITMAGYSRDNGLGQNGEQLTYDAGCRITAEAREGNDSNCLAYKGASGGAVIQMSASGEPLYAGVISRGDSTGLSIYVPVRRFRSALRMHLE
jgi:hypothetical protein